VPAESTPDHAEGNSRQAQPSPDRDVTGENEKQEDADSGSDDDMSGLLSDSDEE
jgi:hypothetical protein